MTVMFRHACLPACSKALLQRLQQSPAAAGDAAGTVAALSLLLPDGQTIYCRAAVDSCDPQQLQALLLSAAVSDKSAAAQAARAVAAAAAAEGHMAQGSSSSSSSSLTGAKLKAMQVTARHNVLQCLHVTLRYLCSVMLPIACTEPLVNALACWIMLCSTPCVELHSFARGHCLSTQSHEVTPVAVHASQALAGGVSAGQAGLRYKKKMMMWGEAEVGYCMMTFVIRWAY
jgi:hypothetical protein